MVDKWRDRKKIGEGFVVKPDGPSPDRLEEIAHEERQIKRWKSNASVVMPKSDLTPIETEDTADVIEVNEVKVQTAEDVPRMPP